MAESSKNSEDSPSTQGNSTSLNNLPPELLVKIWGITLQSGYLDNVEVLSKDHKDKYEYLVNKEFKDSLTTLLTTLKNIVGVVKTSSVNMAIWSNEARESRFLEEFMTELLLSKYDKCNGGQKTFLDDAQKFFGDIIESNDSTVAKARLLSVHLSDLQYMHSKLALVKTLVDQPNVQKLLAVHHKNDESFFRLPLLPDRASVTDEKTQLEERVHQAGKRFFERLYIITLGYEFANSVSGEAEQKLTEAQLAKILLGSIRNNHGCIELLTCLSAQLRGNPIGHFFEKGLFEKQIIEGDQILQITEDIHQRYEDARTKLLQRKGKKTGNNWKDSVFNFFDMLMLLQG